MENAFEERKAAARKIGEETGTKLLIPLIYDAFNCNGDGVSASIFGIWNISMKGEKKWDTMRR